jgi:hypothetical protein
VCLDNFQTDRFIGSCFDAQIFGRHIEWEWKGREGKEKGRNRRCSKIKGKSKDMLRGDRKGVRREKGNEKKR